MLQYYIIDVHVCITTAKIDDIINSHFEVVMAHPEALFCTVMGESYWIDNEKFCKKVVAVVVYGCNIIEQWGQGFSASIQEA